MTNVQELWESTISITGTVAGVAATAAHNSGPTRLNTSLIATVSKTRMILLGRIAASLMMVNSSLKKPQSRQKEVIARRLPRLLEQLEVVCTWRRGLVEITRPRKRRETIQQYPVLVAILEPSKDTRTELMEALTNFAMFGGVAVKQFVDNLDKFASNSSITLETSSFQGDMQHMKDMPAPEEYPRAVNKLLYDALAQHSGCYCSFEQGTYRTPRRHAMRLSLVNETQGHESEVLFNLAVSKEPETHPGSSTMAWQQLRFQVSSKNRKVSFEPPSHSESEKSSSNETAELIKVGGLCKVLAQSLGPICIRLRIRDIDLHRDPRVIERGRRVSNIPSLALSQALQSGELSTRNKLLLAYKLAESVWRYYDSKFMENLWTTEAIHFLYELRHDNTLDMDRESIDPSCPYFVVPTRNTNTLEVDEHHSQNVLHHYPRVLALGVLLIEIGRRVPTATPRITLTIEEKINSDYQIYMDIIRDPDWPPLDVLNAEVRSRFRFAVKNCLDGKLFEVRTTGDRSRAVLDARREILYKMVVHPLKQLCIDIGLTSQTKTHQFTEARRGNRALPLATLLNTGTGSLPRSSKEWMKRAMDNRFFDLTHSYRELRIPGDPRRVRIAILDTGCDTRCDFFGPTPRRTRLKSCKDFVENEATFSDLDGHGSHITSLAMKIAPAAEIYIARVAVDSCSLANASENIAKAIDWAAQVAEVDIVSMSFGFTEEPELEGESQISNSINRAIASRSQRILFFAAAANDGGNQREMFPARHPHVFSIRATDHRGTFLSLNPPPDFSAADVFGTLGENVLGATLPHVGEAEIAETGSSVATPIAAGIAANILGYARIKARTSDLLTPEIVGILSKERGMRLMLQLLSTKMSEKQNYIRPDRFTIASDKERDAMILLAANEAK
ncbi:hypothetical protein T440DRAFT_467121 [Plenodomus tracheiphilus IPT5]|uniref:Uncharacterized protein n=1 Tax=Plenodomus tracheiphilus IPT5 TaxID=1408161 RepID=A0A6A7B909_9PLEO|nr:hypothetical protein T440DRAFT_467121 [Plenodomus tracheiphilus IPT5]